MTDVVYAEVIEGEHKEILILFWLCRVSRLDDWLHKNWNMRLSGVIETTQMKTQCSRVRIRPIMVIVHFYISPGSKTLVHECVDIGIVQANTLCTYYSAWKRIDIVCPESGSLQQEQGHGGPAAVGHVKQYNSNPWVVHFARQWHDSVDICWKLIQKTRSSPDARGLMIFLATITDQQTNKQTCQTSNFWKLQSNRWIWKVTRVKVVLSEFVAVTSTPYI